MDVANQIHGANTRFTEAVRAKDAATIATLYTREGQILPPNDLAVSGDEPIVAFWRGLFDLPLADARPVTLEIIHAGDLAVEVGKFAVFGENGMLLDTGKIMVVWKMENCAWKMHRDMWNSSVQLPADGVETPSSDA